MNTREIAAILGSDIHARRVFKGVYPRNKLPTHLSPRRPSAFIINTDTASKRGEHWVAVWFDGLGKAEYFDSFGLPPRHRDINHFIETHSIRSRYNDRLLQDLTSSACGLYVLYFVMMKSRGASLHRLLAPFHAIDLRTNDRLVYRMVRHLRHRPTLSIPL